MDKLKASGLSNDQVTTVLASAADTDKPLASQLTGLVKTIGIVAAVGAVLFFGAKYLRKRGKV